MELVVRGVAGVCLAAVMPFATGFAADLVPASPQAPQIPPPAAMWTVEAGAEVRTLPRYQGSDDYGVFPVPFLDVRPAGTPPQFHAPRDGIGYAVYDTDTLKAGPVGQIELGRRVQHNPDLAGLGNVSAAAELGGFVEYWPTPWLRSRVEVRQGFGGHHGVVSDGTVDLVVPVAPQWTLSGGPRLTLATKDANEPYFGVDAAQSAASGLPIYDVGGGIRSVGVGSQAIYRWNPQWSSYGFVEFSRLTGDVGDSPVVTMRGSPDQAMVGLGATYSFNVPALW